MPGQALEPAFQQQAGYGRGAGVQRPQYGFNLPEPALQHQGAGQCQPDGLAVGGNVQGLLQQGAG